MGWIRNWMGVENMSYLMNVCARCDSRQLWTCPANFAAYTLGGGMRS
jgi:hypothetical protein